MHYAILIYPLMKVISHTIRYLAFLLLHKLPHMHRHMIISRQYKPECLKRRWRDFLLVHKGSKNLQWTLQCSTLLQFSSFYNFTFLRGCLTNNSTESPQTDCTSYLSRIFCSASINNNRKSRKMQKLEWLETIAAMVQALAACLGLTDQLLIEPSLSMQMFANSQCHTGSSD